MADIRFEVKLWQADGTVFSGANEAGAAVRLRESTTAGADSGEYTGNVAGSGVFTDRLQGLWSIEVDSGDSGWYLVQWYTTATGVYADADGFAPIYIIRDDMLPLAGGTMNGIIVMGDNSINGIKDLAFTDDATGTVGGIVSDNLLDKSASETVTGAWAHTGFIDITASKLKIGGTVVTISAAEANMLKGLDTTSKIMVLDTVNRTTTLDNTDSAYNLGYDETGYVSCDTTSGVLQINLPALSTDNIGAKFIIDLVSAVSDLTIVRNGADIFTFMTASDTQTEGQTITMSSAKDVVCIEALNAAYWMITGGFNVAIS